MSKSPVSKPPQKSTPVQKSLWLSPRFLLFSAAVFALTGTVCFFCSASIAPGQPSYNLFLIGAALVGIGLGAIWMCLVPEDGKKFQILNGNKTHFTAIAAGAIFILFFTIWCGRQQFGGFDHSVVVDVGWRMLKGQTPYKDFPCTLPPGFYLGSYYAFRLFGPYWQSLVIAESFFATVSFLWIYWLLSHILKARLYALLLAFASQAISTMLVAYWWYNPVTSVASLIYMLSAIVWMTEVRSFKAQTSFCISLFLLATMKPNLAGPLIVGSALILITSKQHRIPTLVWSGIAFLFFMVVLWVHHLSLGEMLSNYRSIADRGFSFRIFQDATPNEVRFVKFFLVLLLCCFGSKNGFTMLRLGSRIHGLLFVGAVVALYGILTNGENKLVDSPLLVVGGAIYASWLPVVRGAPRTNSFWLRYCGVVILFLSSVALGEAVMRTRVKQIGIGTFFEFTTVKEADNGFFKNCRYGPTLQTTKTQVSTALANLARQTQRTNDLKIFFGPKMQWAYAGFNLESPVNLPIWWHPGVAFPAKDESQYVQRWYNTDFDALILLRGVGTTYLSDEFMSLLQTNFVLDDRYPNLWVLLPIRKVQKISLPPS